MTDPDPKKKDRKELAAEEEGTAKVNEQSQTQVTNDSEPQEPTSDDTEETEEERDEKTNNLRDALNNDNLALPPDERDDSIVN